MISLLFTIFFHCGHYQSLQPEKKLDIVYLPSITNTENEFRVREIAYQEGFDKPEILVKIVKCESSFITSAINNKNKPGCGTDFGLWQINNKYHPEVSLSCSMDLECSTKWSIWRIKSGHIGEWACANYLNLKY